MTKVELPLTYPQEIAKSLEDRNLIKIGTSGLFIREEGLKLFEDRGDNYFKEFFEHFPKSVPNNRGGSSVKSPSKIDSAIAQDAYKKWRMITRNDQELKQHIINCLIFEVQERKQHGELAYMHNIVTWLNKRYWQMYEDRLSKKEIQTSTKETSL